ncbi:MAG: cytochrome c oxidase subunit II [Actinobacteria bacterium]|nr:cytochrome c oxidase subunit II [Actinomycetota bacterium]MCL6094686.1 cytochrome c oxidase subunit II [Actinomycetota bacterium]
MSAASEVPVYHRRKNRGSTDHRPIKSPFLERVVRSVLRFLLIGAAAVLLSSCRLPYLGMYRGATTQGHDTFKLWTGSLLAAMLVGIIVLSLVLWSVFRFRKRSEELPRQFRYNIPIEIIYTAVPVIIVCLLFYFTVNTENEVDAVKSDPGVALKVTAFQWGWRFHYSGTDVTVLDTATDWPNSYPPAVLPVNETIGITLVSADVVHGFYLRQIDFSRYAQPGVVNRFDLNFRREGVYHGQCTDFCGLYHSEMLFRFKVVSKSAFAAWLAAQERLQRSTNGQYVAAHSSSGAGGSLSEVAARRGR